MENNRSENRASRQENLDDRQQQAVDKTPGENIGKGDKLTNDDLKGKKVDADPKSFEEQPIRQLP